MYIVYPGTFTLLLLVEKWTENEANNSVEDGQLSRQKHFRFGSIAVNRDVDLLVKLDK